MVPHDFEVIGCAHDAGGLKATLCLPGRQKDSPAKVFFQKESVRVATEGGFALLSEQWLIDSSTLQMSSQQSDWRERLHANPSRMETELAIKLQDNRIMYQTQIEIPVTTADFYFPIEPRPLIVFVDGRVHLKTSQMTKDEETRILLRKKGYRILGLFYDRYSDKKRDDLYREMLDNLGKE